MLPSGPTLFRLGVALRSGPDELMGRSPVAAQLEAPPELADTPEARRLLRMVGRIPRQQFQLILQRDTASVTEPKHSRR